MDNNLKLLQRIHAGSNDTFDESDPFVCQIAILKDWQKDVSPETLMVNAPDHSYFYDRLYTIDAFLSQCAKYIEEESEECYFSINSFWKKKKLTGDIRHLNAFALDFDYYKIKKYKDLAPKEMYEKHIKDVLPFTPTAVIDSGRGLYVIYHFKHCSIMRLKLYQCIYKQFYRLLKQYGMDAKAMNVTQVIRIPGTYNVQADKNVEILIMNDTNYEITDFCSLLPYTLEQTQRHKKAQWDADRTTPIANTMDLKKKRKQECRDLLEDLSQLISIRNKSKIYEGYREQLLYIAIEKMLWSGMDRDKAIKKAEGLNEKFHFPLPSSAVVKQCVPSNIYWHSNSIIKILAKLAITEDEQKNFKYLQTRELKDLRKKRLRNKHPLLNRTNKEVELLKRRTSLINLKKKGKTNTQIANSLEINKSTVTRDLAYIEGNKNEFRKVLGETIEALVASLSTDAILNTITYDNLIGLRKWLEISPLVLESP